MGDRRSDSFAESPVIEPANSPLPAEPEVPPLKTLRHPADHPPGTHARQPPAACSRRNLVSPVAVGDGLRNRRIPPRSHNSLLHICPSTHPARPATDRRGNSVILPLCLRCFRPLSAHLAMRLSRGDCSAIAGSGGERARTVDLLLAKQALSQLSYTPVPEVRDQ